MARLDLDDLPPRIANLLLGLDEGEELLIVQHGGMLRRLVAQSVAPAEPTPPVPPAPEPNAEPAMKKMRSPVPAADKPAEAEPEPPPPISSPAVEQKTREIFETFRAAIEDEF
jgi:septal ring-binding cell division protein DamX